MSPDTTPPPETPTMTIEAALLTFACYLTKKWVQQIGRDIIALRPAR